MLNQSLCINHGSFPITPHLYLYISPQKCWTSSCQPLHQLSHFWVHHIHIYYIKIPRIPSLRIVLCLTSSNVTLCLSSEAPKPTSIPNCDLGGFPKLWPWGLPPIVTLGASPNCDLGGFPQLWPWGLPPIVTLGASPNCDPRGGFL